MLFRSATRARISFSAQSELFDIVEGDFERHLHAWPPDDFRPSAHFAAFVNARQSRIVAAIPGSGIDDAMHDGFKALGLAIGGALRGAACCVLGAACGRSAPDAGVQPLARRPVAAGAEHGRLAQDLQRRHPRGRARSDAARSRPAGPQGSAAARPGRVRADAGRLHPGDRRSRGSPSRARSSPPSTAPRSRRSSSKYGVPPNMILAIWGRETAFGGYKLPHNAIRVLATQGYYGRRKDMFREELLLRAQDPGGGPRHARRHAQLLGRRDGADAVPAVGVLQARRRFRRRRQARHLDLGARRARRRRRSSSSTRAGSAARAGPTRCARRRTSTAPSACPRSRSRSANG